MKKREYSTICKHITCRLREFVPKKDMLIMVPMGHVLRGICFENAGLEARQFYMWAFLMPLYIPSDYISLNFGKRLGGGSHTWNADNPRLIDNTMNTIRREALPFLGSPSYDDNAISQYILKLASRHLNQHDREIEAYTLIRTGEYEASLTAIDNLLLNLDKEVEWEQKMWERVLLIKTKLLTNPTYALEQMSIWRERTIDSLRVSSYHDTFRSNRGS